MGNHLYKQDLKLNRKTHAKFFIVVFFTEYGWLFLHLACLQSVFWISLIHVCTLFYLLFTSRNSHPQMFFRVGGLKNFANCTEKHLCWSIFLIKLRAFRTPIQVFCCEIRGISKNTFFSQSISSGCFSLSGYRDFWRN